MTIKFATVLLAGAALAVSSAALADPPTGSRLGNHLRPGPKMTEHDVAVAAQAMGSCMYNRHVGTAQELLRSTGETDSDKAFKRLAGEDTCFNMIPSNEMVDTRMVSFSKDVLRGLLAETAIKSPELRRSVAALQPLPLQQKRYLRPWFVTTGRDPSVDEMGACIADTNPAAIMVLVGTEPKTAAENTAFGALGDSLGKCLSAGTRLQASRQALRSALADALYQRMWAPALSVDSAGTAG